MKCKGSVKCQRAGFSQNKGLCNVHWEADRRRRVAAGEWRGHVDAAPVIEHLNRLVAGGFSRERIARVTGLSTRTLLDLPMRQRVWSTTADKLLAIDPSKATYNEVEDSGYVPVLASRRKLQSLEAMGHQRQAIAQRMGMTTVGVDRIVLDQGWAPVSRVKVATARRVDEVWREMQMEVPAPGPITDRVKRRAEKRGWATAFAWDEDDIDNPAARPHGATRARTLKGDWEIIDRMLAQGQPLNEIAAELGMQTESLRVKIWRRTQREKLAG